MKQGWEIKKLGEVCHIVGGGTPSKDNKTYYSGDILWATVRDMKGDYIFDTEYKITLDAIKNSSTNIIPKNNVIIATRVGLGKVCVLKKDAAINQDLKAITPKHASDLSNRYLYFWFKSISKIIISQGVGATVKGVKLPFVKNLDIPVPSIPEQERIVGILDSAFAKIEALQANAKQNLQSTKDLFQASLKQEFTPKQEWKSKRLNEICEVKDGTHDSPKYVDDGILFVTQKNITIKGFDIQDTRRITVSDHEKFYKRSNVEYGDILISMIGANRGMSCIVDVKDTFSIKNVGLVKQSDNIKQHYLLYYLQSPMSAKYVADASNGGAQEFIGLTALRAFPILFPKNREEQQTIVEKLDALNERCRAMEQNYRQTITACNALKQALLTKAFNGEL